MRRSFLGAAALPLLLVLAACSSGGGATSAPTNPPSQAPAASEPAASEAAASSGTSASSSAAASATFDLKIAAGSGSVTNYLTGADGRTLYMFKNDTVDSGKSTCNGGCAATWPPFTVDSLDEVKPDAAATGTLALVTRDDGTKQISYKGMPLYYYSGDTKAGDTAGQGFAGKWFVVHP